MNQASADPDEAGGPTRPLTLSQTRRPATVWRYLLENAERDGWIVVAVNFNAAIFLGLVPLTAGYGVAEAFLLLGAQATACTMAALVLLLLSFERGRSRQDRGTRKRVIWLTASEVAMMLGWGAPAALFLPSGAMERDMLTLLALIVIGVISAALTGRLPWGLVLGRMALFAPPLAAIVFAGGPNAGMLFALGVFGAAITLAVGYAAYVQHLAQAAQAVLLRETRDALGDALQEAQEHREQALREVAMRERFMHSVTHDLRQPVGALGLYLDEITRRSDGEASDALEAAQSCVLSANGVIDSVAQIALITDGLPAARRESVALGPLFDRLMIETHALAAQRGLRLRRVSTSLHVLADGERLQRALRNLLHNALQYTDAGGVLIGARRRGAGRVAIEVWDTGRGVPETEQGAIFEAFHQGSDTLGRPLGSIGLGLSIVREFVDSMGGEISLESAQNRGSRFTITLAQALSGQAPDLTGWRVMVVDDDPTSAERLSEILRLAGAEVQVVAAPDEILNLDATKLNAPDALALDLHLSPGLDALRLLKIAGPSAPSTVIVTDDSSAAARRRAEQAGVPLIPKSDAPARLAAALAAQLNAGSQRG